MYGTTSVIIFTGAEAIMARLFSGRISNNLLRLEIYSSLVMPGVISPSSSNYERKEGKQPIEEISKGEKRI